MTSWVTVIFNDKTGTPSGLWRDGSTYGIGTLKTNDPEKALRRVFSSFADRSFFISRTPFASVTFSYRLADGTPQQKNFTRGELKKKQLEYMAFF